MIQADRIISYNINLDYLLILHTELDIPIASTVWERYLKKALIISDPTIGKIVDTSDYTRNILEELHLNKNILATNIQEYLSNSFDMQFPNTLLPHNPEQIFFKKYEEASYKQKYIILVTHPIPHSFSKLDKTNDLLVETILI
ncbi:hypothetical protein [Listeria sp. PSOL-1]|uniref:hypothetical protein n=1 Tax=Listeria sp. PSOL-1 TaxID=1844999 RepID=UPI0013D3DC87|nr:hypothetical protein [Listeria sp. PSOL-1]